MTSADTWNCPVCNERLLGLVNKWDRPLSWSFRHNGNPVAECTVSMQALGFPDGEQNVHADVMDWCRTLHIKEEPMEKETTPVKPQTVWTLYTNTTDRDITYTDGIGHFFTFFWGILFTLRMNFCSAGLGVSACFIFYGSTSINAKTCLYQWVIT